MGMLTGTVQMCGMNVEIRVSAATRTLGLKGRRTLPGAVRVAAALDTAAALRRSCDDFL